MVKGLRLARERQPASPTAVSYLALGIGILGLGISAILVRAAEAPGTVTSFYRMAVATALLFLPFIRRVNRRRAAFSAGIKFAILGGVAFALDLAFWSTGVVMSGATIPTLLANTAPLWVGLGALVFFKAKLDSRFWFGLILAMIGSVIVLGLDTRINLQLGMGSFYGLLAGVFYGGYFLITQHGRRSLDSLVYFWPAALSSTVALGAIILVLNQPLTGYSFQTYLTFLALGVITQVIGYLAINYALGYMPATIVSPTLIGQPLMTALFAWVLLGETVSIGHILGGVGVLIGVTIVHRSQQTRSTPTV